MKIKSIGTLRNDLNLITQKVLITRDFELPIGEVFIVYSISIWEGILQYLIVENAEQESKPFWFPAELFVVEDYLLPSEFYYKYFGLNDIRGVNALWGYKEMVLDDNHYVDLIERNARAEEIFLIRKRQIDDKENN